MKIVGHLQNLITARHWFEPRTSTNSPPEPPSCNPLQHQMPLQHRMHYGTFQISSRRLATPSCQCPES